MKITLRFCFLIVLCLARNFDIYSDAPSTPVFTMNNVPGAIVNGSVNIITGDYCENSNDLVLDGPEPLDFNRFYSNAYKCFGSLGYGWFSNHSYREPEFDSTGAFILGKNYKGLTNCASGEISGRTNLKNYQDNPFGVGQKIIRGDGGERFFKNWPRTLLPNSHEYASGPRLHYETKPSGNKVSYLYDPYGKLIKMIFGHRKGRHTFHEIHCFDNTF
ncbi:MAG: hypothetical protein ACI9S8_001016 [Chlamydiales bacterium]|jgi:hypothetical protein